MNFRIVEGKDSLWDRADEFMEYYNDYSISITKLIEKMGITRNQYRRLRNYCDKNGWIVLRRRSPNQKKKLVRQSKNYRFDNYAYIVEKTINNEYIYFGRYKRKWEAEEVVKKLKECNWDKSQLDRIKEEVLNGRV